MDREWLKIIVCDSSQDVQASQGLIGHRLLSISRDSYAKHWTKGSTSGAVDLWEQPRMYWNMCMSC